jgi:dipeptidyl aminopeptidase/acylaminoacyl peptidase
MFSPDGSSIVFQRWVTGQPGSIYRMPASGGTSTPLTSGALAYAPDFSPDGSHIVYDSYVGGLDTIMVMDADGANAHALTSPASGTGDDEAQFSPDGTQIAYTHYSDADPNNAPIMLMNADGSNALMISAPGDYAYAGGWQPTHPAAPAPSPAPAAVTAPTLTLAAPKKESVRQGRVYLFATSSKTATGAARGKVSVPKLAKSYRLRRVSKTLSASTRTKLSLKIPAKTLRAAHTAFAHHQRVKATVVVRVKDVAGNVTSKRLSIRLTG